MAEATGDAVPVENRRPQKELPSFDFFLSLPDFSRRAGNWHGQRKLNGAPALIEVTAYTDQGGFPVIGTIGVSQGAGKEQWRYKVETHGAAYSFCSANQRTLASQHFSPRKVQYECGIKLKFIKPLRSPKEGITPDNIDPKGSEIYGSSSGTVSEVVQDLCSLTRTIQASG
ncbi:MAG: hypothetical protein Q7S79_01905 [bacterium]|nr:hypothetical protein [bacterium]